MKEIIFILIVSSLLIIKAKEEEEFPTENNVIVLTDKTFDKALEKYEFLLVQFYAPWCGFCKQIKPEFEKASEKLRKENYFLAKVDATSEIELTQKYNISGYPTIKYFIDKEPIDYKGGRKEEDIIKWIKNNSKKITEKLDTIDKIEKFLEYDMCTIYYGTNKNEIKEFKKVAKKIEDFPFGIANSEEIISKYGKEGTVIFYKDFDELKNEITTIKEDILLEFYKKYSEPKVLKLDFRGIKKIYIQHNPALMLFVDENKEKLLEYEKLLKNVYEKINEKIKLVLADFKEGRSEIIGEGLGAKKSDLPKVLIVDTRRKLKKYVFKEEINEKNLINFIKKWEENKLSKFIKSQEEPKENNGPVYTLVSKTFEKIVIKNDKDVMVLFCNFQTNSCRNILPIYTDIAKILKANNPKLVLAMMDGMENELESLPIHGFPSIKFFPGNKKDLAPLDYIGERNFDKIIKFIQANSAHPIKYIERTNDL